METTPLTLNTKDLKSKATKVGKSVKAYAVSFANGNASIRVIALAGGVALVFDSLACFFSNLFQVQFIKAVINFYAFIVGASAIVMESDQEAIPYATKLRPIIGENLGVVRTVTGRGLFYGVAATLEISEGEDRSTIIGWIMLFIGLAYIILGKRASQKLMKLRNQAWPDRKVKSMFNKYDEDGNGTIEFEEFYKLLLEMNVEIAMQEAELMYLSLDKDMTHALKYEEFQKFWQNSEELTNSFRV